MFMNPFYSQVSVQTFQI